MNDNTLDDRPASVPARLSSCAHLTERQICELASALQELERQNTELAAAKVRSEADREHYRDIFLSAPGACLVTDGQGVIWEANQRAVRLLDVQLGAVVGQSLSEYVVPHDRARFFAQLAALQQAGPQEQTGCEIRMQSRTGTWFPATLTGSWIHPAPGMPAVLCWFVCDWIGHDQIEVELLQAEKLALTAKLVALLAEQLDNPLQVVVGCLGLAQETLAGQEEASSYLRMAAGELDHISAIVARLRELYQRPVSQERGPTDLNALIEKVLALVSRQLEGRHIKIRFQAAGYLPLLAVVPGQIEQVLLNLVLNSVEAMPTGGQLDIRLDYHYEPAGAMISVADTRSGAAPGTLPELLSPPCPRSDGLDLRLYGTRRIVEAHGGYVEVESCPDKGTTCRIWLPD